jgi:hypothetical protein
MIYYAFNLQNIGEKLTRPNIILFQLQLFEDKPQLS